VNDKILPPAIFLMGPTASGKTGLAVELHERFSLDIISVDSALVYRGMDIGTAKPDAVTLSRAPHRLIDIRDPWESYSAAEFRKDALGEMSDITRAGRVPLLVGGTMLYFKALLEGLSKLPSADPELRQQIDREAELAGWPAMHARLARLDPHAAARINPNDPQRIQRALEVMRLTGTRMSELQRGENTDPAPYRVLKIVVCPESRAELHRRISMRFDRMLKDGFEDEVRNLHANPTLEAGMPAMRAVGYRQAWSWLDGVPEGLGWTEKAIAATRQLAKRQLTWLRKESNALWYDLDIDGAKKRVYHQVRDFLKSGGSEPTRSVPHDAE
jgi:tRNA dimethylallyltransferase